MDVKVWFRHLIKYPVVNRNESAVRFLLCVGYLNVQKSVKRSRWGVTFPNSNCTEAEKIWLWTKYPNFKFKFVLLMLNSSKLIFCVFCWDWLGYKSQCLVSHQMTHRAPRCSWLLSVPSIVIDFYRYDTSNKRNSKRTFILAWSARCEIF